MKSIGKTLDYIIYFRSNCTLDSEAVKLDKNDKYHLNNGYIQISNCEKLQMQALGIDDKAVKSKFEASFSINGDL